MMQRVMTALAGMAGMAGLCVTTPACDSADRNAPQSVTIVRSADLDWQQLNPARGDQSPQAANVWGDRTQDGQTGFLVKFIDGFASPPHIHNVAYRGVVIGGLIHNDDPEATPMWMPPGSFWTQPAGEAHITASSGPGTAYIEIEAGPYRVKPTDEAFESGQRPVNVTPGNLVWLDSTSTSWISRRPSPQDATGTSTTSHPMLAFVWGTPQSQELSGSLVKLPAGFHGEVRAGNAEFRAIIIQGATNYQVKSRNTTTELDSGSYFSSTTATSHRISCAGEDECLMYVRCRGSFEILQQ